MATRQQRARRYERRRAHMKGADERRRALPPRALAESPASVPPNTRKRKSKVNLSLARIRARLHHGRQNRH